MTLPIRIEKDEILFFIAGCAVEAIQWEVEGMRYEEWHAEHELGHANTHRAGADGDAERSLGE
jgi:hypothetical protein